MMRRIVIVTMALLFLSTLGAGAVLGAQTPQTPLPGSAIPQFVDPVPNLLDAAHLIVDDGTQIELEMKEHQVNILPAGTVTAPGYSGTWVWSYLKSGQSTRTSYLGPVIVTSRDVPTEIKFVNKLGNTTDTKVLAYKNSIDQTLHWADPLYAEENMCNHMAWFPEYGTACAANYTGSIPAAVHIHGGMVPPQLDGGPDSWFTSDGSSVGHAYYSRDNNNPKNYAIYRYPNSLMEGTLIWFHDHTLGATRLNVYAGLAGGYLIADPALDPANLPDRVPLVVQDRMFDTNGQLFFPSASLGGLLWTPNPEHPYWVPEFLGDVIVVNGKSWPFMAVAPKRYTLMFINGSNARTYEMSLTDRVSKNFGPPLWVIGTDGGYLDAPVKIDPLAAGNNKLVMMPGERYWVIVDFKGFEAGKIGPNGLPYSGNWLLKNTAKSPFPAGASPNGNTTGRIMEFRVAGGPVTDTSFNPATPGARLRGGTGQGPAIIRLSGATRQATRQLTLNEVMGMPQGVPKDPVTGQPANYPGGPLEILVNNTKWNGKRITGVNNNMMYTFEPREDFTPDGTNKNWLSERPEEGTTEVWEIVNITADAHPIHLHLVQFQLLNRQNFNTTKYNKAYAAAFPVGYDYVMGATVGPGAFIPGYGPPLDYKTGNPRALGGNPDITPFLQGAAIPPLPQENGWKDTVTMYPGQVTRILVRWAPTDLPATTPPGNATFTFNPNGGHGYVWHCHIIDHEDNEMMRPTEVIPKSGATRSYIQGIDY